MNFKKMNIFLIIVLFFVSTTLINAQSNYLKAPIDINEITINDAQDAMDNGYLSAELLTQLYLDRINAYNKQYEAIIAVNPNALSIAKVLDQERQEKGPRSVLHGIPIIIKDNYDLVGLPTTAGAKALWDLYPVKNAFVVQKLIDAGAIIIAKANMSTFAFSGSSSTSSFGDTTNAYNINYSSYGSSGGSAVAVSANLALIGLGTDTNSSVRGPASVNGIVGLRPTLGLISRTGILPYTLERDTSGPMTRTVTDLATILDFMVGYDEYDVITETSQNNIPQTYTDFLKTNGLEGKTIGIIADFIEAHPSSSIPVVKSSSSAMEILMENAIEQMKDLGANVVYIDNFYTNYLNNLQNNTLDAFTFCEDINNYFKTLNPNNRIQSFQDLMNDGRYLFDLTGYAEYCNHPRNSDRYTKTLANNKAEYKEYVLSIMEEYQIDVFAYPTFKTQPNTLKNKSVYSASTSHTISPIIGFPSITVPMGFDEDGLPYGLQFTAKAFEENKLIEIAYSYEQATKHRTSPTIAPGLYEVPTIVNSLVNKVEKANDINTANYTKDSIDNFVNNLQSAQDYLNNYNEAKADAQTLLSALNNSIDKLETKKVIVFTNLLHNNLIIYPILAVLVMYLLLKIIKKSLKKGKK